jgi:branched-chain amino acid transport system substrate-binding protein
MSAGVQALLTAYQARAPEAQVDLLGHYMAPLAYAQMQVVSQVVEATGGFDDMALAAYARTATFHTVAGGSRLERTASGRRLGFCRSSLGAS